MIFYFIGVMLVATRSVRSCPTSLVTHIYPYPHIQTHIFYSSQNLSLPFLRSVLWSHTCWIYRTCVHGLFIFLLQSWGLNPVSLHWVIFPVFSFFHFGTGIAKSWNCSGWAWTCISPVPTSQSADIADMHHHTQLAFILYFF